MNAEYRIDDTLVEFTVEVQNGQPPLTHKVTSRTTCGKYIVESVFVYEYFDVQREVAVYALLGTGKRLA